MQTSPLWFHAEVWQCTAEIRVTPLSPWHLSISMADPLLSCPVPTRGSSPPTPQILGGSSHGQGRLEGTCFSTRDELVGMLTQSCPKTSPEQVCCVWWSPFPELHRADGPLHTLLALQGESYVRVGELADDPEMHCVFEEFACPC